MRSSIKVTCLKSLFPSMMSLNFDKVLYQGDHRYHGFLAIVRALYNEFFTKIFMLWPTLLVFTRNWALIVMANVFFRSMRQLYRAIWGGRDLVPYLVENSPRTIKNHHSLLWRLEQNNPCCILMVEYSCTPFRGLVAVQFSWLLLL